MNRLAEANLLDRILGTKPAVARIQENNEPARLRTRAVQRFSRTCSRQKSTPGRM